MQDEGFKLIFRKKNAPIEILEYLYAHNGGSLVYGAKLAKDLDITYSHTTKVLKKMLEIGLISKKCKEDDARFQNIVKITDKGKVITEKLIEIKHIL